MLYFLDAFEEADQFIAQADSVKQILHKLAMMIKFLHVMKVTSYMLMLIKLIILIFLQNN